MSIETPERAPPPATPVEAARSWMRELRTQFVGWMNRTPDARGATHRTPAYVELIFTFGLARVGAGEDARAALARARAILAEADEVHRFLLEAYAFRIEQALAGKSHTGPLPNEQVEYLEHMERLPRYAVDRLRKESRILEPDQRINPYRFWGAMINDFERRLAELNETLDPVSYREGIENFLASRAGGREGEWRVWPNLLRRFSVAGPDLVRRAVTRNLERRLANKDDRLNLVHTIPFAFRAVSHYRLIDLVGPLTEKVTQCCQDDAPEMVQSLPQLISACIETLVAFNQPEEADQFLCAVSRRFLDDRTPSEWGKAESTPNLGHLQILLAVADGWFRFGWDSLANPILERARRTTHEGTLPSRDLAQTACATAHAVGSAARPIAREHFRLLLEGLPSHRDNHSTRTHFNLSVLEFAEAVCLSAVAVCSRI